MANEFLNKLDQDQIEAMVGVMYAKEYGANSNVITQGETGLLFRFDHCSEFFFLESKNQVTKPLSHCYIMLIAKKCITLYMHAFLDTSLLMKHILCLSNHPKPCRSCRSKAFHIAELSS
jgi:hypothetical protein